MKTLFKVLAALMAMFMFFSCDLLAEEEEELSVYERIYNLLEPIDYIEESDEAIYDAAVEQIKSDYSGTELTASDSGDGYSYNLTYNGPLSLTYNSTFATTINQELENNISVAGTINTDMSLISELSYNNSTEEFTGSIVESDTVTFDLEFSGADFETISGTIYFSASINGDQMTSYYNAFSEDDTTSMYDYMTLSMTGTITANGTTYDAADMESYFLSDFIED